MTDMALNAPKPRVPRWAKGILVVSLALNLAVVGLVVGIALRISGPNGPMQGGLPIGIILYRDFPTTSSATCAAGFGSIAAKTRWRGARSMTGCQRPYDVTRWIPKRSIGFCETNRRGWWLGSRGTTAGGSRL